MPKNSSYFLGQVTAQLKSFKTKLQRLKEQRQKAMNPSPKHSVPASDLRHEKPKEHLVVEFSMSSVAKATLVILGLLLLMRFLQEIQEILILIFVALFLSAALDSIVDRWQKRGVPRALSIVLIYLLFLGVLALFLSTLVPLIANQTLELARTISDLVSNLAQGKSISNLPYSSSIQKFLNDLLQNVDQKSLVDQVQLALQKVGGQLQAIAGSTVSAIVVLFNGVLNAVLVLILTFFMVVDEKAIEEFFVSLFPSRHANYIIEKTEAVKEKVGYWLRGQLKLIVAMSIITFIGLTVLGVEYALTLALLAGLMELLPVIGPIVAMIPALLIGLNDSLSQTFWILLLYLFIQQIEGNVLVPLIMNKAVGLSPLIIMVVMLVGYTFLGVLGIIISVPVATSISIFIKDYSQRAK